VYRTSDINELIERLADGLGDAGEMFSYWEGPTETALYFYGASAAVMRERMAAVLASHSVGPAVPGRGADPVPLMSRPA
jgi:hypothetical protein